MKADRHPDQPGPIVAPPPWPGTPPATSPPKPPLERHARYARPWRRTSPTPRDAGGAHTESIDGRARLTYNDWAQAVTVNDGALPQRRQHTQTVDSPPPPPRPSTAHLEIRSPQPPPSTRTLAWRRPHRHPKHNPGRTDQPPVEPQRKTPRRSRTAPRGRRSRRAAGWGGSDRSRAGHWSPGGCSLVVIANSVASSGPRPVAPPPRPDEPNSATAPGPTRAPSSTSATARPPPATAHRGPGRPRASSAPGPGRTGRSRRGVGVGVHVAGVGDVAVLVHVGEPAVAPLGLDGAVAVGREVVAVEGLLLDDAAVGEVGEGFGVVVGADEGAPS